MPSLSQSSFMLAGNHEGMVAAFHLAWAGDQRKPLRAGKDHLAGTFADADFGIGRYTHGRSSQNVSAPRHRRRQPSDAIPLPASSATVTENRHGGRVPPQPLPQGAFGEDRRAISADATHFKKPRTLRRHWRDGPVSTSAPFPSKSTRRSRLSDGDHRPLN